MSDIGLTQAEADALLALAKVRVDDTEWAYPVDGKVVIPLVSQNRRESFLLDIRRGSIALRNANYQTRARKTIILARLDIGGRPHRNPDGVEMPCPHLHVYREGYDHKWAYPIDPEVFADVSDLWQALLDFMRFAHIVEPPRILKGIFT
jgi:hypothetical protein